MSPVGVYGRGMVEFKPNRRETIAIYCKLRYIQNECFNFAQRWRNSVTLQKIEEIRFLFALEVHDGKMGTTIFTCHTVWLLETNECGCVPGDVRPAQDLV